jgi:hypothetical protein
MECAPVKISLEKHDFSEEEFREASKLTNLSRLLVTALVIEDISEKLQLVPDTLNPQDFFLKNEYLRGKIEAYQHLLAISDSAA